MFPIGVRGWISQANRLTPGGTAVALPGVGLLLFTLFVGVPGHLTWDSGTYHLAAQSITETADFFVDNGYETFPSRLLRVGQTVEADGHLVSQYPAFHTLLAAPLHAVFGYRGLLLLNALAFLGINALIWRLAGWFSDDRSAPVLAVLIYSFATFGWEYTQSSYPHLTSTFLILLACWLGWGAALDKNDLPHWVPAILRSPAGRSSMAGLVFGLALGVRLDAVFAALALGIPLLTGRGVQWGRALAMAAGALPMIAGLAWINLLKFGAFNPFTYGKDESAGFVGSLTHYAPMALCLAGIALVYAFRDFVPLRTSRRTVFWIGAAAVAALLLTSPGLRLASGLFQILVDMRIRPDISEPALSRSAGGAVLYFDNVKKGLIESCPYLVLIVLPALSGMLRGDYGQRRLLWLVPIGFAGFYGYLAWHGSVALNMRYLNPALPFLALLASHEWLRVRSALPPQVRGRVAIWLWAGLFGLFLWARSSVPLQEMVLLNGALLVAGACLVLQIACHLRHGWAERWLAVAVLVALAWSSAVSLTHDYLMSASVRLTHRSAALALGTVIEPDALILAHSPDPLWALRDDSSDILIADYTLGTREDAEALVEAFAGRRPVYWVAPQGLQAEQLPVPVRTPAGDAIVQGPDLEVGHPFALGLHRLSVGG